MGFGAGTGVSKQQIEREVTELLDGIPQRDAVLGSPRAPITVWVYGDLQCPTVKLFAENYLPSIVESWVRTGVVRLDYRSLKTDTFDEEVFFEQERAALAAGRQRRMWNFVLTFVRQQGEARTPYVTEGFLAGIASQVPGLRLAKWQRDRDDPLLSKRVALSVYHGHQRELSYTPSLVVGYTEGEVDRRADRGVLREEVETSLRRQVEALREESRGDIPTIKTAELDLVGG